jgi:hypothetical protein
MQNTVFEAEAQHLSGQEVRPDLGKSLSSTDRRLILRASLGLLLKRLNHNVAVTSADIARLAAFVDDQSSTSAVGT